jgi:hypothetical protein
MSRVRHLRNAVAALLVAGVGLSSAALEVRTTGDVRWVSGGVGIDERDEMIMALPDYNFKLLVAAEKSGAYLSAVRVVVHDVGGRTVLDAPLAGPWLLSQLPPGRYELTATYAGRPQTRSFTIPADGRRELFLYWAVPDVETLPKGVTQ